MSSAHLHVVPPSHADSPPTGLHNGQGTTSIRSDGGAGERGGASAAEFSETVRVVVSLARGGGLEAPVFRSPPGRPGADRTIRWRLGRPPVVAVARGARPLAAVQADVIEALVVVNELDEARAGRFRRAAWDALEPVIDLRDAGGPPERVVESHTDRTGQERGEEAHIAQAAS